ncbi:MAG: hypothetical protein M0Z87_03725 [Actinomycetota bacterium]|nr:hypothetical protein [Actinomycetota bacterium]
MVQATSKRIGTAGTQQDPESRDVGLPAKRSAVDRAVRQLLRIGGRRTSEEDAQRVFSVSITLSALRCTLSYVVLPILAPLLGVATSIGPYVGIPVAILALIFDAKGIRRFWLANYRLRWQMTFVYLAVMGLVTMLLVDNISQLLH